MLGRSVAILTVYFALNSLLSAHVFLTSDRTRLANASAIEPRSNLKDTSFTIKDYPIEHHYSKNVLDLEIKYTYKNPRIASSSEENTNLSRQLQKLLENYPNEDDYWEIFNSNLTKQLLKQNKELASVSIALAVHPNQKLPYDRVSTVTRLRDNRIWESWHFDFRSNAVQKTNNRFAKLNVEYTYKTNKLKYPDFVPIYKQMEQFIVDRARKNESWESIDRQLTNMILKKNPKISYLSIELVN